MHTLWSRAVKHPGPCRQVSRTSYSTVMATCTASRVVGRTRGLWPSSTFFYSTIFATGLVVDGHTKRKRNQQWDAAFSSARGSSNTSDMDISALGALPSYAEETLSMELGRIQGETATFLAPDRCSPTEVLHHRPEEIPAGCLLDAVDRAVGMSLITEPRRYPEVGLEELGDDLWQLLPFDNRMLDSPRIAWPQNSGPPMLRHHLPPQSLWSSDSARWKALRRRHSLRKLAVQELSIAGLVYRLLEVAGINKLPREMCLSLPDTIRELVLLDPGHRLDAQRDIDCRLNHLVHVGGTWSDNQVNAVRYGSSDAIVPDYHQDDDGEFHRIAIQLSRSIKHLLSPGRGKPIHQVQEALAHVCNNLLVSTAPPDVHTFNALLMGLTHGDNFRNHNQRRHLVELVIHAYDKCKIRPNEITCAAILSHYTEADKPERFSWFVARMRGIGDALMLARPDININEVGERRLVRRDERTVFQKVYPTPLVFQKLMAGAVKFAGIGRALDIYYDMKDDGWGLDMAGLTTLLKHCVNMGDWENGLHVWREFKSIELADQSNVQMGPYRAMLALCAMKGHTTAFNQVLSEAVEMGIDRHQLAKASIELQERAKKRRATRFEKKDIPPAMSDSILIAISGFVQDHNTVVGNSLTKKDSDSSQPEVALEVGNRIRSFEEIAERVEQDVLRMEEDLVKVEMGIERRIEEEEAQARWLQSDPRYR